jgi:hypothetical protein
MLLAATAIFLYYTAWTLLMVCLCSILGLIPTLMMLASPLSTPAIPSTSYSRRPSGPSASPLS